MTHSEPTPGNGDNSNDIDFEFRSFLDAETMEEIEFGEHDLQSRMREDKMINRLLDDKFPLLAETLKIRTQLGIESGLTELYEHLVFKTGELRDEVASTPDPSEDLTQSYQLAYLQSRLVIAIQQLAAAKGAQESVLDQAQKLEDGGDIENANQWRDFAHETRKEAEAQALMNESLGEKTATRMLLAVAPEFEGESLLPVTAKSQEYLMMYRLKEEKSGDDRTDLKAYTIMAQDMLESKLLEGQKQHPDFEDFSFSLSYAIARNLVAPRYTQGYSPEQLEAYTLMISHRIAKAVKLAPQIGLEPAEVRSIYEDILSQLS